MCDVCIGQWQRVAPPTLLHDFEDFRAPAEESASEMASMAWGWLAGCPHYKPSHHLAHKHGYHFR